MITLGILAVGVLVALGVMMASFEGGKGGSQAGPSAADARAYDSAIATLQERLRQNPADVPAMVSLGDTYYDAKRWTDAIPWYEKALQSLPNNTDVRTDLGTAYLYSGNSDKAKEHWFRVLEQDPNKVQTHFNLAVLYSGLTPPDLESAAKEWETVIKIAPTSEQAKQAEQRLKELGRR